MAKVFTLVSLFEKPGECTIHFIKRGKQTHLETSSLNIYRALSSRMREKRHRKQFLPVLHTDRGTVRHDGDAWRIVKIGVQTEGQRELGHSGRLHFRRSKTKT